MVNQYSVGIWYKLKYGLLFIVQHKVYQIIYYGHYDYIYI